jgi:hypothetical protein
MDNARSSSRRRTLKTGRVVLTDWSVLDCVIRDLSETGARLEFGGPVELPQEFRLLVASSNLLVPTELAWVRGTAAGVRFTGPGKPPPRKL